MQAEVVRNTSFSGGIYRNEVSVPKELILHCDIAYI